MKIVLSKNKLLVFFSIIIMLMPSVLADKSIFKLLNNAWILVCIGYLILKKYRFSLFSGLTTCYFGVWMVSSFFNHITDIHIYIMLAKMLIVVLFIDCIFQRDYNKTIDALFVAIVIYVLFDFLTILFFPNGLYQTTTVWNQWSSSSISIWFLGNKNNRLAWYLAVMILSFLRFTKRPSQKKYFMCYGMIGLSVLTMLLVKSSTSLVVVSLIALFEIIALMKKVDTKTRLNAYLFTGIYIVIEIIILSGFTNFLAPFVEKILGKSLTFSGRTLAWLAVIPQIIKKPLLGSGYMSGASSTAILGSSAFVNVHNQWLQTLWETGIMGFLFLIVIFFIIICLFKNLRFRIYNNFFLIVLIGFLVECAFEVFMSQSLPWIILLILYHTLKQYQKFEREKKNEINFN